MTYAATTLGYNFSKVIGTSPYYYITGAKANLKYLHPSWSKCYVNIPLEFRQGKLGCHRAHKARFVGYDNTTVLFPDYLVMEILDGGVYGKMKSSKDIMFDNSIVHSFHTVRRHLPFYPTTFWSQAGPLLFPTGNGHSRSRGLMYNICEMYIDDCIVYGNGTDQFCTRFEEVIKPFDSKHLFLKAAKCKLGLCQVEYVGKTTSRRV